MHATGGKICQLYIICGKGSSIFTKVKASISLLDNLSLCYFILFFVTVKSKEDLENLKRTEVCLKIRKVGGQHKTEASSESTPELSKDGQK